MWTIQIWLQLRRQLHFQSHLLTQGRSKISRAVEWCGIARREWFRWVVVLRLMHSWRSWEWVETQDQSRPPGAHEQVISSDFSILWVLGRTWPGCSPWARSLSQANRVIVIPGKYNKSWHSTCSWGAITISRDSNIGSHARSTSSGEIFERDTYPHTASRREPQCLGGICWRISWRRCGHACFYNRICLQGLWGCRSVGIHKVPQLAQL